MANVYVWPAGLINSALYTPPTRVRKTMQWDGAPGQKVEHVQRSVVEVSGRCLRTLAADLDIIVDQVRGGINLVAVWDNVFRLANGWDLDPALNSSGVEYWRADGRTSLYAGESAGATWRTVSVTGTGSAGSTSLSVSGLLAGEVVPRGAWVRAGDYRHRTAAAATADGTGNATLTLASELRATVSGSVSIPGDLFVGTLVGDFEISPSDASGNRPFRALFSEVYADEVDGGSFTWKGL